MKKYLRGVSIVFTLLAAVFCYAEEEGRALSRPIFPSQPVRAASASNWSTLLLSPGILNPDRSDPHDYIVAIHKPSLSAYEGVDFTQSPFIGWSQSADDDIVAHHFNIYEGAPQNQNTWSFTSFDSADNPSALYLDNDTLLDITDMNNTEQARWYYFDTSGVQELYEVGSTGVYYLIGQTTSTHPNGQPEALIVRLDENSGQFWYAFGYLLKDNPYEFIFYDGDLTLSNWVESAELIPSSNTINITLRIDGFGLKAAALGLETGSMVYGLNRAYLSTIDTGGGAASYDKFTLWNSGQTELRGANIHQRRIYPDIDGDYLGTGTFGAPYVQSDFDKLSAMGANYVNISHPGLYTDTPPYGLDSEAQSNLDTLLSMIAQADMFAVISFRTGPGRNEFAIFPGAQWYPAEMMINNVWTSQSAQDAWVEMWKYTAQRYKGNPIVAGFDLMVEPNSADSSLGDESFEPDNFYPAYQNTLYDWAPLAKRISEGIRSVDPDTPILVGGMGYSSVAWLSSFVPVTTSKTVQIIHQYEPQDEYTHQETYGTTTYPGTLDLDWDGQVDDSFDKAWLDSLLSNVDNYKNTHSINVHVNEFGVHRWVPGGAQYMTDSYDLYEKRGMNHALWWWAPAWEPLQTVSDGFTFTHGPNPNNHTELSSSDLIDAIKAGWSKNTKRPSNTGN